MQLQLYMSLQVHMFCVDRSCHEYVFVNWHVCVNVQVYGKLLVNTPVNNAAAFVAVHVCVCVWKWVCFQCLKKIVLVFVNAHENENVCIDFDAKSWISEMDLYLEMNIYVKCLGAFVFVFVVSSVFVRQWRCNCKYACKRMCLWQCAWVSTCTLICIWKCTGRCFMFVCLWTCTPICRCLLVFAVAIACM